MQRSIREHKGQHIEHTVEIVYEAQTFINDLLEKLAEKGKRMNNITATLLGKVFEIVKRISSFQDFIVKQSSDEKTKKMLKASKMTIDSGIESDLNDMISTVREVIHARDTMETLSNKPIQEHEFFSNFWSMKLITR